MPKFPEIFQPSEVEVVKVGRRNVEVSKVVCQFVEWTGKEPKESFGGKPFVELHDKPMFAELAIMKMFEDEDWNAKWIETYARPSLEPAMLSDWTDDAFENQVDDPITDDRILDLLGAISSENGDTYAGCWDVLAWQGEQVVFAEAKHGGHDSLQDTQIKWLKSSLKAGLKPGNFLIIEWSFRNE